MLALLSGLRTALAPRVLTPQTKIELRRFAFISPTDEQDNFAHRTAVRKALAKDKEWQERFLIPNLAFIDKQEVEITYLVPWCKIGTPPKEVHVLWWNESADSRAAGRHWSHEDPRVVAAVRESVSYLESQQNTFLIPTSFSPLK